MKLESPIYEPYIPPRLKKFFNKHIKIIDNIFALLKHFKPTIVNSFKYSIKNPPPNPNYKYTEKLYLGCIFFVIKYGSTWESFIGPIPGKQLNKRHNEYLKYDLYSKFFNQSLKKYLTTHDIKYLSMDASILNNKNCNEFTKHLPYNKNRKGAKISIISDDIGSPLNCFITESTTHDCKIGEENINDLASNEIIKDAIKKTNGYAYLLADSGYDSSIIKNKIKKLGLRYIIHPNNRKRDKNKPKLKIKKRDSKKYNKRIKIEHFFGIIKRHPKINCVYERKLSSFFGVLMFLLASILLNRYHNT